MSRSGPAAHFALRALRSSCVAVAVLALAALASRGALAELPPAGAPTATPAQAAAPDPAALATFAEGHRALREERREDARRAFEASVAGTPELADHALYWSARLARSAGDRDAARARLARLLDEHPDSIWVGLGALERGEIELEDGTPALAVGSFDLALGHWEKLETERAKLGKARALEAQGRHAAAWDLAFELAGSGPPIAVEAAALRERLEARGAAALGTTPAELARRRAEALLRDGQPEAALAALDALASGGATPAAGARDDAKPAQGAKPSDDTEPTEDAKPADDGQPAGDTDPTSTPPPTEGSEPPDGTTTGLDVNANAHTNANANTNASPSPGPEPSGAILLLRARILAAAGRREEAREVYAAAAASSDPAAAGHALHERARAAWNQDRDDEAAVDFAQLVERHPEHEKAAEAVYALGRIAEKRGDLGAAASLYETVVERYPSARQAEEAAWRAGFVRLLAGDRRDAAALWEKLSARDDALYWHGRALLTAGDVEPGRAALAKLGARSPWSYYVWWTDAEESAARPEPTPAASLEGLSPRARAHLTKARLLRGLDLGLDTVAAREIAAAEHADGPSPALLAEYESVGSYPRAIRLALALRGRGVSGLDPYLYPRAHGRRFEAAAREHGVDPLLLAALARQESLFDARAHSPAGAHGVMQLMPATATTLVGRPVGLVELESPERNIDLGTRYLRRMLDRYDGRVILAVAAYNAGPEAVDRWLALSGTRPGDEFVELISYRETREYVKAVLRNYRVYRALYGIGPPPRLW